MNKKSFSVLIASVLCFFMPLTAFANGFYDVGYFSNDQISFAFEPEEAVLVYNKQAEKNPYYDEVYSGSDLYIPIYIWDDKGSIRQASDKEIKDYDVQVSYKASLGGQCIDNISIVDGKKSKLNDIPSGAFALVEFSDTFIKTGTTPFDLKLLLSVNKITDQGTRISFKSKLSNWVENIKGNSVYGARQPSVYRAYNYSGEATFDFGLNTRYTAKVVKGERYYLNLSREPNTAISTMYPKTYMEFLNFVGDDDTFASTGRLEIPIDRSKFKDKQSGKTQVFIYEIVNDTLKALNENQLSFDGQRNILTLRTGVLGEYVISSQPLMKQVENDDEDDIIYTGYASATASSMSASTAATPSPSGMGTNASSAAPTNTGANTATSAPTDTIPAAQNYPNENVNTGLSVYVENKSTGNPETSDSALPFFAAFGMLTGALTLLYLNKKRTPGSK